MLSLVFAGAVFALVSSDVPASVASRAQIFAPGIISGPANDGSPSFMPDGKTLFFTRTGARGSTIMESHRVAGRWTTPVIAPFSGTWNDQHAFVAPGGSFIVFVSTRPVPGMKERVSHVWRVNRVSGGWSAAIHLSEAVNRAAQIFAPSVAADGSIYFLSIGENRSFQLYSSTPVGGAYATATPLAFSSPATADVDPTIAPDRSFLVFSSAGRNGADDKQEHLYIAYAHGGEWGGITRVRYEGDDAGGSSNDNEPELGPDGRSIYFSSDRTLVTAYPRTHSQALKDMTRIDAWDNGNTNVWVVPMPSPPPAPRV